MGKKRLLPFERKTDPDFAACCLHGFSTTPFAYPVEKNRHPPLPGLTPGLLNPRNFHLIEQKSAEFRTFTKNQTDIFIEAGNGDEDVEVTTALRLKAQSVSSSE
jgi:hypothetical protein